MNSRKKWQNNIEAWNALTWGINKISCEHQLKWNYVTARESQTMYAECHWLLSHWWFTIMQLPSLIDSIEREKKTAQLRIEWAQWTATEVQNSIWIFEQKANFSTMKLDDKWAQWIIICGTFRNENDKIFIICVNKMLIICLHEEHEYRLYIVLGLV